MTDFAAFIVTVHAPLPVQAPLHPVKDEPLDAAGLRVTTVPEANAAAHVAPQLTPAGEDVTVPAPVPLFPTVSV